MANQDLKKIEKAFDQRVKPLHSEIVQINRFLEKLERNYFGFRLELTQLNKEVARLDSTVNSLSSGIEEMKDWLGEELGSINLKLDEYCIKEIKKIKQHVGLTS